MERDRVAEFVGDTSANPVQLSAAERHAVVQSLKDRLNVDVEAQMPWNAADSLHGTRTANGWKHIPVFVAASTCLVFSAGAASIWKFFNGTELLLVLEASPPFEFYVCDELQSYLLCCNDHDVVIGWGCSVEWVSQLKSD